MKLTALASALPAPSTPGMLARAASMFKRPNGPPVIPLAAVATAWLADAGFCKAHATAVWRTLQVFGEFLGHEPTTADLAVEVLNRWIDHLFTAGLSQWTVRGHRAKLVALWNAAHKAIPAAVPLSADGVRSIARRPPAQAPWSAAEVGRLLAQVDRWAGNFPHSGVGRRWFWRAFILAARDTWFLPADLLRIEFEQITPAGVVALPRGPSGKLLVRRLQPETMTAIAMTIPPKRPLVFGGVTALRNIHDRLHEMTRAAGLSGAFKRLRCGSQQVGWAPGANAAAPFGDMDAETFWATYLQRQEGGAA